MQQLFTVDAFTDVPFRGNPAAVCVLDAFPPDEWMQSVAREMALSETAFITRARDHFDLRWFTPAVEVDLCGHATLAAAHVLWNEGVVPGATPIAFETHSGRLRATFADGQITLDFPSEPVAEVEEPDGLTTAVGAEPTAVFRNRLDLLVLFESERLVKSLVPHLERISRLDARGVIATAAADGTSQVRTSADRAGYDYVSRYFAPRVGVPEDPVTGSTHCALGPFWSERLGKEILTGYQASARGGYVTTRAAGTRTYLSGQAVSVYSASLSEAAASWLPRTPHTH